jgi:hypothetical protein
MAKIRFCFLLPCIIAALIGCGIIEPAGGPVYHGLSIRGDEPISVANQNKYDMYGLSGPIAEGPTAVMAEAGDLLYLWNDDIECFYRYDPGDGQTLAFTSDPGACFKTFLNGQLIILDIYDDDPAVWEWLEKCDTGSLQHLRSLQFHIYKQEKLNMDLIRKIAKARPAIGLYFEADPPNRAEIITLFTPTWLVAAGSLDFNEENISRLKKLRCLYFLEPESLRFIEKLPNLESLILSMDDDDIQIDKLPKLRSLTLIGGSGLSSLAGFRNKKRLRNLYFIACELDDLSPVGQFTELNGLGFMFCQGNADLAALPELPRLRWISFPEDVSQDDFAMFLVQHPRLKVVDLFSCNELDDISPLASLSELQGLTLDVAVEDLATLYGLKGLEVLTLGEDQVAEEEYQDLQAALPGTRIALTGFCLGSGWLLLIIPMILMGRLAIRLAAKRAKR